MAGVPVVVSYRTGVILSVTAIVLSLGFLWWIVDARTKDCIAAGGVELIGSRWDICIDADGRVVRL